MNVYRIVWIFDGGIPWRIWRITGGSPNFTIQSLTMSRDKWRKQTNRNLPMFYSPKVSDGKFAKIFLHQTFALYGISKILAVNEPLWDLKTQYERFTLWQLNLIWISCYNNLFPTEPSTSNISIFSNCDVYGKLSRGYKVDLHLPEMFYSWL